MLTISHARSRELEHALAVILELPLAIIVIQQQDEIRLGAGGRLENVTISGRVSECKNPRPSGALANAKNFPLPDATSTSRCNGLSVMSVPSRSKTAMRLAGGT